MTESDITLHIDMTDPAFIKMGSEQGSIYIMQKCRAAGIPVLGFMRLDGVSRGRMVMERNCMTDMLTIKWSPND